MCTALTMQTDTLCMSESYNKVVIAWATLIPYIDGFTYVQSLFTLAGDVNISTVECNAWKNLLPQVFCTRCFADSNKQYRNELLSSC